MTYREQFEEALKCSTEAEANTWIEKEIARYKSEYGQERKQAETTIRANLGYMAGYYDEKTAVKVQTLFGARHPVFGHSDYWKNLNAEDCFRIGRSKAAGK